MSPSAFYRAPNAGAPTTDAPAPRAPLLAAADAYYALGAGHVICQDFALAGRSPRGEPYAIVSDGCSSARHSELGARLLGAAARLELQRGEPLEVGRALRTAWHLGRELGLPPSCLDATLLQATVRDGRVQCLLAGDGVLAGRRRDGTVEAWAIEAPSGAPPYPSYLHEPARLAAYLATGPERRIRHWRGRAPPADALGDERSWLERITPGPPVANLDPSAPVEGYLRRFDLAQDDFELVMLLSDGASSFGRVAPDDPSRRCDPVPLGAVLGQLLAVPSTRGEFVVRRCRRFLASFCREHGWQHHDDLAVGAIGWEAGS
jgi:hypothetical protein